MAERLERAEGIEPSSSIFLLPMTAMPMDWMIMYSNALLCAMGRVLPN
ncbi:MAG: hypothetical protein ACJAVM_003156 [Sulfitobacter sp.]|jgi:hypothetical protein